jgi:7,8-dihydroneopterin aldolase/epimerase/oxygenase
MLTIELRDLIFHAHHGIFEEEKKIMNKMEVHLSVSYDESGIDFSPGENFISYVHLYNIVKHKIEVHVYLLERICQDIILEIKDQHPYVKEIRITIYKLTPPIENFTGKAGVTMHQFFEA